MDVKLGALMVERLAVHWAESKVAWMVLILVERMVVH